MEEMSINIVDFTLQQNNYKCICQTHVLGHENFKFFVLLQVKDKLGNNHMDELFEGIQYAFNKLLKSKILDLETAEPVFEKSIKDFNLYINDLINISNIPISLEDLKGVIGIVINDTILFSPRGDVHAIMSYKTKNAAYKLIDLLQDYENTSETSIFDEILTGKLSKNQAMLLCTHTVPKYLSDYSLKNLLINFDVTENTITAGFKEITNNENFAGIIIKQIPKSKAQIIEKSFEKELESPDKSIGVLEKTRSKTQELLSPTIGKKALNYIVNIFKRNKKASNSQKNAGKISRDTNDNILDSTEIKISPKEIGKNLGKKSLIIGIAVTKHGAKLLISGSKFVVKSVKGQYKKADFKKGLKSMLENIKKLLSLLSFKKKSTIIILIALIIIILVFIFSSYWIKSKKEKKQFQQEYSTLIKKLDENLLKAESSVIHKAEGRASIYITQTEKLLNQLPKYSNIQDKNKSSEYYEEKIIEINDKIRHIRKISDPTIYSQLPQEFQNAGIKGMEFKENMLYIYSDSNPYMAMIDSENKEITLLDSDTEFKTTDLTIFDKYNNSPILTTDDNKTYVLNKESNTLSEVNVPFEKVDPKDIKTYSSNLYALDPQNNQIYKYVRLSNTNFGSGKEWLSNNSTDLSSAVDMYIDGSIYILLKNGKLYNYLNGQKQAFALQNNVQPTIEFTTKFVYSDSKKQFYILEPENNRILVYGNKGEFKYQYMSDKFNDLKDISFDDKTNTLIILNSSTLYSVTE